MLKAKQIEILSRGLSVAMLSGPWDEQSMIERMESALGEAWRWCTPLSGTILSAYKEPPAFEVLAEAITHAPAFRAAISNLTRPHIIRWFLLPTRMDDAFPDWGLPRMDSADALGRFLELTHSQLVWLADIERRRGMRQDPLRQHYRSRWCSKRRGGWRLLEEPLPLLKQTQRRILHELLDRVPPHPAACGFRRSRSTLDYAAAHTGKAVVIRMDLRSFFPSVRASRVHALMTTLGYPGDTAGLLTGLCTTTTPTRVCRAHNGGDIYSSPHLPQGAPTSPALANLAAYRLDCRLAAASAAAGANYTRYADDLAFSGDDAFARRVGSFKSMVWRIVYEEGFELQHRKTRIMRRSVRQKLCGIVVNDRLNIDRREYDRLKAILTNCIRYGFDAQNRDRLPDFVAHLQGRVAYMSQLNPARGERLLGLLKSAVYADVG